MESKWDEKNKPVQRFFPAKCYEKPVKMLHIG
jgi:hypothetical protein